MLRSLLLAIVSAVSRFLSLILKALLGLRVDGFDPTSGWPGTIFTIKGRGFSTSRDGNVVFVGGARALILEAEESRLLVLAGETTVTGPVRVEVGADVATSGTFTVLPTPDPTDVTRAGPPRFFHGPQQGTPATNVQNQPVLVILLYPTDHDPGGPAARASARGNEITSFEQARTYWNQASFGSTTWVMTYTDWVPLPKNRRSYFWEPGDVNDARASLLRTTSRPLVRSGSSIIHGSGTGFIPIDHPNPLTWSFLIGASTGGSVVLGLARVGNLLYAGTAAGGFFIFDVTNPGSAVLRGSVAMPFGSIWDIQIVGTTAVVALGNSELGLIDVTNPAAPAVLNPGMMSSEWTTTLKAVGNRIYAGHGTHLAILDLVGGALNFVAEIDVGAWVTSVDVSGTTCAVATDGGGLKLLETTAGGAVERGTYQGVSRIRAVRLAGGRAYLAANAAGLVILDVTKLTAPTKLGQKVTKKPAYNLDVSGTEAVVAVGNIVLASINISDPAAPTINGTEMASGYEPSLDDLQNALTIAQDSQDLVKNSNRFFIDSLNAYFAATGTGVAQLSGFKGIILVVNGGKLRGQSWTSGEFADAGQKITLNDKKGAIYLATGAHWGRKAHEIGHWLGMWDIYEDWYADGTKLEGTAAPWCLSGNHDNGPLFCGHHLHQIMHWYTTGAPTDQNSNVRELAWSPTQSFNDTFDLVAHGATQDTTPNRFHVLKLVASSGLIYFVEVRQRPAGLVFDQNLDLPAGESGRVIVLRVSEGTSISNTFERPIQLVDKLLAGQQTVDAARNLVIKVEAKIQDDPLAFRVRVQWNQPIAGDPNGKFDLTITPWSTETWESPDIWVDSPRNNSGAGQTYEFHEPGKPDVPILNGDRPWVKHVNKLYARIRNTGPQAVPEVWVSAYVTSPPGIGDNGSWQLLKTKKLENFPGRDPNVPGSGEVVVDFDWVPAVGKHTCLSVAVMPQIGEIETNNNKAQENVATFDSGSGSSHEPVILDAEVRSPFTVWRKVDLLVRSLPLGWHAVVDQAWVWLPGKGSHPVRTVIWNDLGTLWGEHLQIPELALPRVEGWTHFDDRYLPIGGILAPVKAVKKVAIEIRCEAGGGVIYVQGELSQQVQNVPITIEITNEKGQALLLHATTDISGHFSADTQPIQRMDPGPYSVQAFVTAGGAAAETESPVVTVVVKQ
ncbi:MAG TPA: IPT/TIG domain-containing protein [Verrucomicrobiota bacterium]|nr:hypothetical protein [Verrucomicrobiales bacterium]HRI15291.1 IPT/TIG domain-containing protein [Verrucomicrobiota bacterium]